MSVVPAPAVEVPRHAALEALADGFCMADADYRVTYWNAAAERLFGVARDDAAGRVLWDVLPGAADPRVRERIARVAEQGTVLQLTVLNDRELFVRHLSVHVSALDGGVALHVRDATAEQRVADQYDQLLESIRDGFIAVDREWKIVYVNRSAEVLVSLRRDRAVGVELWEIFPAEPAYLGEAIRATMRDREPRHLDALYPVGRVFRGRCFDVNIHPLPDGGVSMLFEDVTERIAREVELARLAAEAEEASRAKSRFFAAVSHELRTPLNAIVGYTHLLATHTYGDVPAGAARASERASVCAEHLARLVDDVLLLTTLEIDRLPVFRSRVELSAFLPGMLPHLLQQLEAKCLAFALEVPDELPALETDPERLRQIVTALLGNAIKFTSRGGVRLHARATDEGRWMEVAVADTGPGVPEGDRERVFAPFEQLGEESRTDSLNRGTGLGLSIARQLARRLGGDIAVRDPVREGAEPESGTNGTGAGAEFVLRLPLG
ncbi:PAS domain-containing sensor histidine kinase [Longimicrobium sp.]|uniref:sensor histidine kinase n=1 Tax=Longimicrobium sp. TaxID=2029185 RepID=UPI002E32C0B2|nr:PAS domain-containing sensor histidine kinase [Longimicrobium sp.]HEX6041930.1 PAS domain-containing sensor histidine kinase [Longimicrobium sp.]